MGGLCPLSWRHEKERENSRKNQTTVNTLSHMDLCFALLRHWIPCYLLPSACISESSTQGLILDRGRRGLAFLCWKGKAVLVENPVWHWSSQMAHWQVLHTLSQLEVRSFIEIVVAVCELVTIELVVKCDALRWNLSIKEYVQDIRHQWHTSVLRYMNPGKQNENFFIYNWYSILYYGSRQHSIFQESKVRNFNNYYKNLSPLHIVGWITVSVPKISFSTTLWGTNHGNLPCRI